MSKYWSKIVKELEPYVPGEQPKDRRYIKLNTNENPYPPSPKVIEAIKEADNESLRLYPDPDCSGLREALAGYFNLQKEQIFAGNGSDEILAFSFMAFFNPGEPVLFPDITYSFYPVYCKLYNLEYKSIPLDEDFNVPVKDFFQPNGGIIIANPNAPTGKYLDPDSIEQILKNNMDRVVIIDEAYIDFGGDSAAQFISQYPNLLIIGTLSKSRSLAGLRIGFAAGHKDLIEGLDRVKNSFNSYTIDRLALAAGTEAIKDISYFEDTRAKVIATRERTVAELKEMGFRVIESKANFMFISNPSISAKVIFSQLRESGILVRYFNKPRIDNFLRISIGTDEEMNIFLKTIKDIVNTSSL